MIDDDDNNNSNSNSYICKAHNVSNQTESEAPAVIQGAMTKLFGGAKAVIQGHIQVMNNAVDTDIL